VPDVPKIKWLHEEVLQRYVKENPGKWKINGKKVLAVNYNEPFNTYPDLFCTVEDEQSLIPVEVEWRSSDFIDHDHDINVLRNGRGEIFVLFKNMDNLGVSQYKIPYNGFKRWVKSKSEKLLEDTVADWKDPVERKIPKLWIQYIGQRGGAIQHYEVALSAQTWGIPKNSSALKKFKEIRKNDLIMFVIQGRNFPGRPPYKEWHKKSFKGKFEKIKVFRITSKYYPSNTIIWNPSPSGEIWPHRFNFDELNSGGDNPLLNLREVQVKKMRKPEKRTITKCSNC